MDAKKGTLSEKSFRTGTAAGSRQGSRAVSRGSKSIGRSEVSRFFKKGKNQSQHNVLKPDTIEVVVDHAADSPEKSAPKKAAKETKEDGGRTRFRSQMMAYKRKYFVRKLDCGNPRYFADKAPS